MEPRYSLRFETGERAGETIPVQGQGFTIGRRPGHTLQILDNSVSGKHAEIAVDGTGALLRDLGSTNGTRVGGERVLEKRLSHGDRIHFGNVQMVFVDASAGGAVPGPAATAAAAAQAPGGEGLARVSLEVLAGSRRRSLLGLFGLVLLVGAGGGLWFFFGRRAGVSGAEVRVARAAPDNLLGEDFSFESGGDGWTGDEGAPAAFLEGGLGRVSGAVGLHADLSEGAYALHRSREIRTEAGRELVATAEARAEGAALAQVGIELAAAGTVDAAGPVAAWSRPSAAEGGAGHVEISVVVPPGFETARVLLLGRSDRGGSVEFDDVSLVAREAAGSPPLSSPTLGEWHLGLLGDPPTSAVLSRFGRCAITDMRFAEDADLPVSTTPATSASATAMTAGAQPGRLTLASPKGAHFHLRAEAPLVRAGLATIGAAGYATHGLDFERSEVTSLLLGQGGELVRLAFVAPVDVKGVAEQQASMVSIRSAGGSGIGEVALQLDFTEDRKKAGDLAYAARNAEKKGDLGECLARWAELLNGFPFEAALVTEAESKRGALVQQGLQELQGVRAEIERARFFRLVDLYRQCRQKATAVGARFRGSEVEAEAQKVTAEVDAHLSGLEADLARAERGRLEAILATLDAQQSPGLAAKVREHLASLAKAELPAEPPRPPRTER